MTNGECIKIIGLDVNCFEANIIAERNVKNNSFETRRIVEELSTKYPKAIWVTVLCRYQI